MRTIQNHICNIPGKDSQLDYNREEISNKPKTEEPFTQTQLRRILQSYLQKHQGHCGIWTLKWTPIIPASWWSCLCVILSLKFGQDQQDMAKEMRCHSHDYITLCLRLHHAIEPQPHCPWRSKLPRRCWRNSQGKETQGPKHGLQRLTEASVLQQQGDDFSRQPAGAVMQIFSHLGLWWEHSTGWHVNCILVRS